MKNRESVVSPLSLCGGVIKDPENEAVSRIESLGSLLFPPGAG